MTTDTKSALGMILAVVSIPFMAAVVAAGVIHLEAFMIWLMGELS